MNRAIIRIQYSICFLLLLASCVSKKEVVYFQNGKINQEKVSNNYKTIFKPDDLLQITISSEDVIAVKPFNLPVVSFESTTNSVVGAPQQQSYLIDSKGEIDFPILGKIKLGGLTREEGIKLFKEKLSPDYVKDPTINIRISNFRITVTGDVRLPGSYVVPNERISILDAIGLAGDLNISAERENVLVIREEGDKKVSYRVNLLSNETFTSPVYYLQQNDFIFVEHNNAKIQAASFNSNSGLYIAISSVLISLITLIVR